MAWWAPERPEGDPLLGCDGGPPAVRWGAWFEAAQWATWVLFRRDGWAMGVPLRGRRLSGCEQTVFVAGLLSRGDPAAVEGAAAGVAAAVGEIRAAEAGGEWRWLVEGEVGAVPKNKVKGATKRFPHGKSIKHSRIYDALIAQGMPKSRAAAISNATTPKHSNKGKKGKR